MKRASGVLVSVLAAGLIMTGAPAARAGSNDFWLVAWTANYEGIVFVDRETVTRSGDGVGFWYENVFNGATFKDSGFKTQRIYQRIDCTRRTSVIQTLLAYGGDGKLSAESETPQPEQAIKAGSVTDDVYNFVCKRDESHAEKIPVTTPEIGYADSLYARHAPAQPSAPAAAKPAPQASATPPAFWLVGATGNGDVVAFVDRANLSTAPDGKTTFTLETVNNAKPDSDKVKLLKSLAVADCTRRTYAELQSEAYAKNGKLAGRSDHAEPEEAVAPGSLIGQVFAFVCDHDETTAMAVPDGKTTIELADQLYADFHASAAKPAGSIKAGSRKKTRAR
jgi:hypothetical protein